MFKRNHVGSLERLVETSFKPNNAVTAMDYVAQQVMVAKRAFGADVLTQQGEEAYGLSSKKAKLESSSETLKEDEEGMESESRTTSPDRLECSNLPSSVPTSSPGGSNTMIVRDSNSSSAELKFLKYSELARELSGR